MKILIALFLLITVLRVGAQESDQDKALRQTCEGIAVKLYPDVLNRDSRLMGEIVKLEKIMKSRDSTIFDMPQEPLIVAGCAADILKIQPAWSALSDDEKETAYYSAADAMVFARDLAPLGAENQTANKPFNPGSMDDGQSSGVTHHGIADLVDSPPRAETSSSTGVNPNLRAGYIYFYNTFAGQGVFGCQKFESGPYKGMTSGQLQALVQQKWGELSPDEQLDFQQKAQTFGSGPDPASPTPTDNQYNVNVTTDPHR